MQISDTIWMLNDVYVIGLHVMYDFEGKRLDHDLINQRSYMWFLQVNNVLKYHLPGGNNVFQSKV